jgi:hypothetical protein
MSQRPEDAPMEVDLPDGGRVIVAFADVEARMGDGGIGIVTAMVWQDGSEAELERAIVAVAEGHGLRCSVSDTRHPTTVVVHSSEGLD